MARPEKTKELKLFDEELKQLHMTGQWIYDDLLVKAIGGPRPKGEPYIWKWNTVYPKLVEACAALPESFTARRSLLFQNLGIEGGGTTHTLLMGIQMIKPGEVAWAHRHTMAAIRFVIQGDGKAYTAVDGEICPMEDYDLILTPQWTWHDHHNPTDKATIWLDALDVPLILGLNLPFYEPYLGNQVQPTKEDLSANTFRRERERCDRPGKSPKEKISLCVIDGRIPKPSLRLSRKGRGALMTASRLSTSTP